MMKHETKTTNRRGITLTELLIAAVLVGIVMAGAVAVDFAVRRSRQNVVDSGRVASRLDTAMLQVTRDAMATTGDATNVGIAADNTGNIFNICFRYDQDNNPNNYTGDHWACYSQNTTQANVIVLRCDQAVPLTAEQACTGSNQVIGIKQSEAHNPFFTVNLNAGQIQDVTFLLATCADTSQAENPITNPCQTLRSTVNLSSFSR